MPKTIAWIDDDIDIIKPVIEPLEDAGYIVNEYATAADALERWQEIASADLILLDMLVRPGRPGAKMGEFPGIYILDALRNEYKITLPVIVFSVVSQEELNPKLAPFNVAKLLRKPIRPSRLRETVEQILQTKT